MPEKTVLHKFVLKFFKPELVDKEGLLDHIFFGLLGIFVSIIFLGAFGLTAVMTPLYLRMGMFISYTGVFIFILFTLYYSMPILDYVDDKIGDKKVSKIIRFFSYLIIGAILFFIWPTFSSFISITQETGLLIAQKEFTSLIISLFALFSVIIPIYLSNVIFDNFNFKLEVEKG